MLIKLTGSLHLKGGVSRVEEARAKSLIRGKLAICTLYLATSVKCYMKILIQTKID